MAKSLPEIDTATDTFLAWIIKTNTIIQFCNTEVVTANNSANGGLTTGKGYVIGSFGANTLYADTIRAGNTTSNGTTITVTTNTVFSNTTIKVDSGITMGANSIVQTQGLRYIATNTTLQAIDTFAVASHRSAKYVISVTDPTSGAYQATEILVMHSGTNTYSTEYASMQSNNQLSTFQFDINSGNVRLLATPTVSPLQYNIARTLVSV